MPRKSLRPARNRPAPIELDDRCQFLELPGEIRNEICSYLLRDLKHVYLADLHLSSRGMPKWRLFSEPEEDFWEEGLDEPGQYPVQYIWRGPRLVTCMPLLTLNKQISQEARGLIYGPYAKELLAPETQHAPTEANIFSLFGRIGKLHKLHMMLDLATPDHVAIKDLRQRIELFVDSITHGPSGADQVLQLELVKEHSPPASRLHERGSEAIWKERRYLFCAESLSRLRSSNELTVSMDTAWLERCLTLCVRGTGGPLAKAEWTQVVRYPTQWSHRRKKVSVILKQYWHPENDWQSFAARNHIDIDQGSSWLQHLK